ncbi:PQQ-binding-like beta-propeller repeat protein [Halorarum halophilum]|uniref:PQQ-binding-like beta-propeller repeat protein n=1 Tax=Halorarum halophilum TaxID=2743090 RepID=A0A7D5KF06_9EURY|nr:FG-GAP-like repeat-containing protein [Halobaculum halophilum]QLG28637.1 PQQ-binding-like beta-propeller repeat protein [Halobaculum halophilum]
MRPRTAAVLVVLLGVLLAGVGAVFLQDGGVTLSERWVSETGTDIRGNHHPVAAGRIDGEGMVYAPVSAPGGTSDCRLVGLHASNGSTRWSHAVPPANCTLHAVADPAIADPDRDGTTEVFAASTTEELLGFDAHTGAVEFRVTLSEYGYTKPVIADLTGDGRSEIAVVDVSGTLFVYAPDGSLVWERDLGGITNGAPQAGDFTGDGTLELAVGTGAGEAVLVDGDGTTVWNRSTWDEAVGWTTSGQADADPAPEFVVATTAGTVGVLDGVTGETQWRRDLGTLASVHAFGDGDGDGDPEVYAGARDSGLRAFDARTGDLEWTTTLTTEGTQMMPPPLLGDLDGDGDPELVAATNDGLVSVVDPSTGEVLATYSREQPIYTHPTLADADGDGAVEAYVIYGDGRVVALGAGTADDPSGAL